MKLSLMAAISENRVIGSGPDIPWSVKGEQLLFKAMTFNHWLIVGRKTFESMGKLPNRKYAVISRNDFCSDDPDVLYFNTIGSSLDALSKKTERAFVSGGGEIYKALLPNVDEIHLSIVHKKVNGDVFFPELPDSMVKVFEQHFESNINYTYQIWKNET